MVCFMNKVDAVEDEELLELVELELRDLLTFYECACCLLFCPLRLSLVFCCVCTVRQSRGARVRLLQACMRGRLALALAAGRVEQSCTKSQLFAWLSRLLRNWTGCVRC